LGGALCHVDLVSLNFEDFLDRDHLFDMRSFGGLIVFQVHLGLLVRARSEGVVCIDVILLPSEELIKFRF
jgi:hypothetical protein